MTSLTAIFAHDRLTRDERSTLAELDATSTRADATFDDTVGRYRTPDTSMVLRSGMAKDLTERTLMTAGPVRFIFGAPPRELVTP